MQIGAKLGPYQIVALLGAGGMGEVYRARDTKLNREVAIKVLPAAFAKDAERMARFAREAQVLASLNHPNIAAIYGLEEYALVMELVQGELLRGPLPLDEALPLARQLAEALEYAHEKGIVHRDLKPANVKVTPDGKIKVLDFGLAKAMEDSPATDMSNSPTLSIAATRAGVILGSAGYMSPEQARGKPVDRRADVWSFGCVLFELLSGKQVFPGETVSDSIAAILGKDPDWQALPASTPARIRELLARCLQKDRHSRLQDMGDARIAIEETLAHPAAAVAVAAASKSSGIAWAIPALLVGAILGALAWNSIRGSRQASKNPLRLSIALAGSDRLDVQLNPVLTISPDGSRVVFAAASGGDRRLFLRPLDRPEATPIPGTDRADGPFFSPDGQWVGFFADGKLKKVALSGGPAVAIADAPNPRGAVWMPDQTIIFSPQANTALSRVPASGGTPQAVTTLDTSQGETSHRFPDLLPGGQQLLFTIKTAAMRSFDDARIAVLSLQSGKYRILIEGGSCPHYAASGHLVYARAGDLLAVPFDRGKLEVSLPPVSVGQGVIEVPGTGAASFALSPDGVVVVAPGAVTTDRTLLWIDRQGKSQLLPAPSRAYVQPRISPDGKLVAVTVEVAYADIWTYDLVRGTLTRSTFGAETGANSICATWTPNGARMAYGRLGSGNPGIVLKPMQSNGSEETLILDKGQPQPESWSPDGKVLAFTQTDLKTGRDIWLVSPDGDRTPKPFLRTPFAEGKAKFSPDGRWIAYVSDESGRFEVYVTSYPGAEKKW